MLSVAVRRGTAGDNVMLAEMGERTFRDAYASDIPEAMLDAHAASKFGPGEQARELAEPNSLFLIAEVNGTPAGYAKLAEAETPAEVEGERPVELNRIYVETDWIGRGVGPELMQACLQLAMGKGYDVMWLGVWENNPRAIAFYHKWGFVEVGTQIYVLAGESMTDVVMMRALGSE